MLFTAIRRNISQTFQFPQRQSVTITSKRLDEVQTVTPHRDDSKTHHPQGTTKILKDTSLSAMPSTTSTKLTSKKTLTDGKKQPSSTPRSIQMSSSTGQIASPIAPSTKAVKESNYTPSISSIGSNVLRSKTADFERMSDPSKKSRISAAMNFPALQTSHNVQSLQAKIQSPPNPNVTNISISLKTTAAPKKKSSSSSAIVEEESANSSGVEKRTMPIYKRQELISSVQKTIKK